MNVKVGLLALALMLPLATASPVEAACEPPCGWIQPYLDIIVDDKLTCGSGLRLGDEEIDPSLCYAAPTDGQPVTIQAKMILYWEMSEDGTYPHDPNVPIVIDFSSAGNLGKWLRATVTPNNIELGTAELLDPNNLEIRGVESGSPSLWYMFEQELEIVYEKIGEPSKGDLEMIENKGGYQPMFLRMHSGASGAYFKESWALEEFRFYYDENAPAAGPSGESNSTPAPFAFLIVALAALARRK